MSTDDHNDAHFLHARVGLQQVLHVPVEEPRALARIPAREGFLIGNKSGELLELDPLMGTRTIGTFDEEIAALAATRRGSRILVVGRGGGWYIVDRKGNVMRSGEHPYVAGLYAWSFGQEFVLGGQNDTTTGVHILSEGGSRSTELPHEAVLIGSEESQTVVWSEPEGLQRRALGAAYADQEERTAHNLRVSGVHVLGYTPGGVCLWDSEGNSQSVRWRDPVAGDVDPSGAWLAVASRQGELGFTPVVAGTPIARPVVVELEEEAAVRALCFSAKRSWLASAGDGVRLWTWDEPKRF